jgi:hypothetical protein
VREAAFLRSLRWVVAIPNPDAARGEVVRSSRFALDVQDDQPASNRCTARRGR